MRFEEKPDYQVLRSFFQDIMKRYQFAYDGQYDWVLKMNGGKPDNSAMMPPRDMKPPMPQKALIKDQQPGTGGGVTRKSHNFREERKESRA